MDAKIYDELQRINIKPHYKIDNPVNHSFHLHDTYEALFFISGNVSYFVEGSSYPLKHGDLIITNTTEIHAPVFISGATYERIIFHFSPELARYASTPHFNLEKCFLDRPNGKNNRVSLNSRQISEFMDLYRRITLLEPSGEDGNTILKMSRLIEILVFINNAFSNSGTTTYLSDMPGPVRDIINYINDNLAGDLSLDSLEKISYMNRTYLCSLFSRHTGKTIHQYIIYRRMSYAKKLLQSGRNVSETCLLCGFNDYSNFVKTFRKITGQTPGGYRRLSSTCG